MSTAPVIAHIGLAVASIESALTFYRDVLGLSPGEPETVDAARIVSLSLGQADVELLEPLDGDGPIAKFLARRGPGIHHVAYRVADLEEALHACRAQGYRLIDEEPRVGHGGKRVAFIHPTATDGILVELTE